MKNLKNVKRKIFLKLSMFKYIFINLNLMNWYFNRENLRLKDEIEKLQKQLTYEQSKQLVKSPVAHSVSGKINLLIKIFS